MLDRGHPPLPLSLVPLACIPAQGISRWRIIWWVKHNSNVLYNVHVHVYYVHVYYECFGEHSLILEMYCVIQGIVHCLKHVLVCHSSCYEMACTCYAFTSTNFKNLCYFIKFILRFWIHASCRSLLRLHVQELTNRQAKLTWVPWLVGHTHLPLLDHLCRHHLALLAPRTNWACSVLLNQVGMAPYMYNMQWCPWRVEEWDNTTLEVLSFLWCGLVQLCVVS